MGDLKIKDISECINGFTFREKPRDTASGNIRVIQVGDIQLDGSLDSSLSPRTQHTTSYDKFIVRGGDIIFRGRAGTVATLVREGDMPLMVASPLVILRANKKQIMPEYIVWYLNSPQAQRYFTRTSQGTLIKAVGIKELAQMPIPLPSIAIQKKIVATSILLKKEQYLLDKICQNKGKMVMRTLLDSAHNYDHKRKKA